MKRHLMKSLMVVASAAAFVACGDDAASSDPLNLVETAQEAGVSTLVAALQAADLDGTLAAGGPYTVFAPSDAAFDALPAGTLDALLADPQALAEVLLYHVVDGTVRSGDLAGVVSAITLNGAPVLFDLSNGVAVNGANVTLADVEASNGVIHVIDAVLLPPTEDIVGIAVNDPNFSTLVTALQAANLVTALQADGPFTVFAPTDAAFNLLPAGTLTALLNDIPTLSDILLYHVVADQVFSGELDGTPLATLQGDALTVDLSAGVQINNAMVTTADIITTNGVIHVIDAVLLPPTP